MKEVAVSADKKDEEPFYGTGKEDLDSACL
jgi:hypothetical protein